MAYIPTVWKSGDIVTSEKLNKLENGVENASTTELPVVTSSDNGNVLTVVEGAWTDAAPAVSHGLICNFVENHLDKTAGEIWTAFTNGIMVFAISHDDGVDFCFTLEAAQYYTEFGYTFEFASLGESFQMNAETENDYPAEEMS